MPDKKRKSMVRENKKKLKFSAFVISCALIIALAVLNSSGVFTYDKLLSTFGLNYEQTAVDGNLSVHFIDVGQGDCIFIKSDDMAMLIDAGESSESPSVEAYIRAQGVDKLDYVIATHPHSDHIGGLADIISNFNVGKVIVPKIPDELTPTTKAYENFLLAVKDKSLKLAAANAGDVYEIGKGNFKILGPLTDEYSNLNNYSVVTYLTYGENSFIFTGDAESQAEKDMLEAGMIEHADVLKVGHHGSNTSSSNEFLEAVMPDYAVIMCGDNSYNHPHEKTVSKLAEYTDKIYRTDMQGTVVIETNGEELTVSFEKGDN